jgi:hypothetical protein
VVILWSSMPQREWLRFDSVCSFIVRHFETRGGLTRMPACFASTAGHIHKCRCRSTTYSFVLPDPRCSTSALIFWNVRMLDSHAPGAAKARGLAPSAVSADIDPDLACQDAVHSFARGMIIALLVGAAAVIALLILLYRRSAI